MDKLAGIDKNMFLVEGEWETIHIFRGRTIQVLSSTMKMCSMGGTLEAEAIVAEEYGCSQMGTALGEC
jgi:hypothetical protein